MDDIRTLAASLVVLGILLLLSRVIHSRITLFQTLYLPSSVIAGAIGLLIGPEALGGMVAGWFGDPEWLEDGVLPSNWYDFWRMLPSLLINVIFATLFLGKVIPGMKQIWNLAGPQVVFGQIVAWGQHVLGCILALTILMPVFGLPAMAAALIEIGFEGGHGTAAGLTGTFDDLGFEDGRDMALGLATVGVVTGVMIGIALLNLATRKGIIKHDIGANPSDMPEGGGTSAGSGESDITKQDTTDTLTTHLLFVALAIAIGWCLLQGLILFEEATLQRAGAPPIIQHIPLFPLAMVAGVGIQLFLMKVGKEGVIRRRLMDRISGAALDVTIASAIASISVTTLGNNAWVLLILSGAGVTWNVFAILYIAPRVIPDSWFQRGIADFGQSMGMTVTGLLLLRISDPENETKSLDSFGYKQLLFEPVVGGGFFTAASLPLLANFGVWAVLALTASIMTAFAVGGYLVFGKQAVEARSRERVKMHI